MIDLLYQTLNDCIDTVTHNYTNYVKNPAKNFTRSRALTFKKIILMFLKIGGQSLYVSRWGIETSL